MKKTVSIVLLLAILCMLVGCQGTAATQPKKPTTAQPNNSVPSTAGNAVFVYENGFGGSFTITVSPNGSFSYYEGMLSSHLGFGIWTLSGNLLTLTESMSRYDASADAVVKVDYTYCFLYQNNTLFFMADQSDRFMYVKLEDGAAFYPLNMEDPQPICYSVNFEAMYLYGGSGYPNLSTEPQWATSKEQLHDFLEIHGAGALFYAKVAAYDEAFFADNSIIILQFGEGSGSIRHKVRDVVVIPSADDASTVIQPTVERIIPAVGTDDCAWWYIFIEVSKEYGKDHFQIAAPMIENRNFSDSDTLYTVEVVDHFNLLKEPLKRQYKVGDTVTVTLNFRSGPSTGIVLNGEYIGADANSKVTFTMPAQDSILYTATNGAIMPQLSEKFSFEITWGFDGYYNSETGLLKNGHNAELNQDCVTNLTLSHEQLQEIYILLHSVHIYDLPSEIRENMTLVEPSYDLKLTINENGVSKSIVILSPFHPETAMWDYYEELRVVYYKIVNEYIRASEAYRSLPPNTNLYE